MNADEPKEVRRQRQLKEEREFREMRVRQHFELAKPTVDYESVRKTLAILKKLKDADLL